MRPRACAVFLALLAAAGAQRADAQDAGALLRAGIQAYRNLEFNQAAGYLQRALDAPGIADTLRTAALVYLGATEIFRGRPDTGQAVFRRLVRFAPRYRIDRLVFPPEVTTRFEVSRRATPVAEAHLPDTTSFRVGEAGLSIDLFGSTFVDVRVDVLRADGAVVRTVYTGPVGDSLRTEWDGAAAAGDPVRAGRYLLVVTSTDSSGVTQRIVRVPLDIAVRLPDTLPFPPPPPDSLLLPERTTAGPGVQALVGGLALGTAVALLPNAIAPDASLSGARFGVGAAIGLAGFAGFLTSRPGREIPENIVANQRVMADWETQRQAVARDNAARLRRAALRITAGPPQVIERGDR
jgi:hypothetical protein